MQQLSRETDYILPSIILFLYVFFHLFRLPLPLFIRVRVTLALSLRSSSAFFLCDVYSEPLLTQNVTHLELDLDSGFSG